MEKHRYTLFKGRWGISIIIYGQVLDKEFFQDDCINVCDGIWLSFSKFPLIEKEIFCEEDRKSILYAINMMKDSILLHSQFLNRTVIQICSLQYSLCYYQQEAMIAAMMNWCSKVFNFEYKEIESGFDYKNNKYIFEFLLG